MDAWAPPPSPAALLLLGLEDQGAEGAVEIGERCVVLRRGRVADVRGAAGDPSLHDFLFQTGRIGSAERQALGQAVSDPDKLPEGGLGMDREALSETVRALWLERLVRGLARLEAEPLTRPFLSPQIAPANGFEVSVLPLVLDALERRAASTDAEQIGLRESARLKWNDTPHTLAAQRWAKLESQSELRVAALLARMPSAAARLAALLRAGLARLVPEGPSAPAPAPRRAASLTPSALARPRAAGTPTSDALELEAKPALRDAYPETSVLIAELPMFPEPTRRLDDPLDAIEAAIATLEERNAPAEARRKAWREAAEIWLERYGSVDEWARALREAAAATNDATSLIDAARACAATAQTELALAYGRAAIAIAEAEDERTRVLIDFALMCRRIGRPLPALSALRAAGMQAELTAELAAELLESRSRIHEAADALLESAAFAPTEEMAASRVARAFRMAPDQVRAAEHLANTLANTGNLRGAIAVAAYAAECCDDEDQRRNLRFTAAQDAELAGAPMVAADLLLRQFDAEPELDLLYEPLDYDLHAAELHLERAIVLEEIANAVVPDARREWLIRAADARCAILDDCDWETELRIRILELDPEDDEALAFIRERAESGANPTLLADALERAVRATTWSRGARRRAALHELARICESETNEPMRAAWARSVAGVLDGEPKRSARAEFEQASRPQMIRAAELERASQSAVGDAQRDAVLRLGAILAQDPERRDRAISLLQERFDEHAEPEALALLLRVLALRNDLDGQVELLDRASHGAIDSGARARILLRIACIEGGRGDLRAMARASLRILDEVPDHREALIRFRRGVSRLTRLHRVERRLTDRRRSDDGFPASDRRRSERRRSGRSDIAMLRDALTREHNLPLAGELAARNACALAEIAHLEGDHAATLRWAQAALDLDPNAADAALLLAIEADDDDDLPPPILKRIEHWVGSWPALERMTIRRISDLGARAAAIRRLAASQRYASWPWGLALESGDPALVEEGIVELLRDPRCEPSAARAVYDAIKGLAAHDALRAAELAIHAADRFGPEGRDLRNLATEIAPRSSSPRLVIRALERGLCGASEGDVVETLRVIGMMHHQYADLAGEARSQTRLLARCPRDELATDRLIEIYATTNEIERLMAALALRVAEGASDEERERGWLALAAAHVQFARDPEAAEPFARAMRDESVLVDSQAELDKLFEQAAVLVAIGRPSTALSLLEEAGIRADPSFSGRIYEQAGAIAVVELHDTARALDFAIAGLLAAPDHVPNLVALEALALERGEITRASAVFGELIEQAMGPHGRRALRYRRARWLERAGEPRQALDAYLTAARDASSQGALLSSIERLARANDDCEALVKGQLLLAENAHPTLAMRLYRDAARLLEEELASPAEAWEILAALWTARTEEPLEAELLRLAKLLWARDPIPTAERIRPILDRLEQLGEEAWNVDHRARLMVRRARFHYEVRHDPERARDLARAALDALREDEEASPSVVADIACQLASWLLRTGSQSEARSWIGLARQAVPDHRLARMLAEEIAVDDAITPPDGVPLEALSPAEFAPPEPAALETGPSVDGAKADEDSTDREYLPREVGELRERVAARASGSADAVADPSRSVSAHDTDFPSNGAPNRPQLMLVLDDEPEASIWSDEFGSPPHNDEPDVATWNRGEESEHAARPHSFALSSPQTVGAAEPYGVSPSSPPSTRSDPPPNSYLASRPDHAGSSGRLVPPDGPPRSDPASNPDPASDAEPLPLIRTRRSGSGWGGRDAPAPNQDRMTPSGSQQLDGGADALEAQAHAFVRQGRDHEALILLRAAVQAFPGRVPTLNALRELANRAGAPAEAAIASSILEVVDPKAAKPTAITCDPRQFVTDRESSLRDPRFSGARKLLASVWEAAMPLFRVTPPQLGLLGTDRIGRHRTSAIGRALNTLEPSEFEQLSVFEVKTPSTIVDPLRMHPPALGVGPAAPDDEAALRFHLGRGLELSQPENLLLATLEPSEAHTLLAALLAAFGPPSESAVSVEAVSLAAELWRLISPFRQREIRDLIAANLERLERDRLRVAMESSAARAGLVQVGEPRVAILGLASTDPTLAGLSLIGADAFAQAVERSPALTEMIRFALSDVYARTIRLADG